ncbi:MAG: translation initiation factor [Zetaproteobacteria bacterium CG12_big_fil_rev_8_21_14_0_65_55_1124]|nr:MAG: translation initiation factor [Zetaproteobacteria bacterium CG1_02_55_237]PIS20359.1 MAG: translation initiation factor [Zetaproteobacteria bacterium CG08_land_8_20_14_0_20_55_17]PIW42416.1 MAG: translation initiation factor [Zetaproteobacteria bacterium CG12_big_fil_rev_8_21_14_0_65_55_1124]PIY52361.1 MAG: translation initiation factor [Zetaproteobacteria bacterium CG_4_10_14_0_8_um_filter_55_43]PIZ37140.1 MAG: translation initiation factor [Zetaproteobacteria bacterium CG_4_10_14_0_2_
MTNKGRLVYSTEHGQIGKPMPGKDKKKSAPPTAASSIKNPAKQGIRIGRESKGRGGKTVCIISGLDLPEAALKNLLKNLKNQLGTGGAVKNGCIEIQGDHRDKLLAMLEKEGHKAKLAGG